MLGVDTGWFLFLRFAGGMGKPGGVQELTVKQNVYFLTALIWPL